MDSSSLSSIIEGVGDCVVGYKFTRFASTIIIARYFFWKRRWKVCWKVLDVLTSARTRLSQRLREWQ